MSKEREKNDFERSINRLEKLVDNMESGEASLEQNLSWFEEGMDLIRLCQSHLTDAEQRVQRLIKKNDHGFEIQEIE
jgi:exodeoxyribonuclease VII small subunit|tara:strand:- start:626 stop:856 length:231 start_codon:yes stop_codon:yes gene_type:complete